MSMNFYLRDITFVTDVSVPTIQTFKLMLKPVFPKQFHFLKPLDIFMTLLKQAKKGYVCEKGNIEDVEKVCIEVQKTSKNVGGKPTRGFSLQSEQNMQCFEVRPRLWKKSKGIA